jgi:hypothetical protein
MQLDSAVCEQLIAGQYVRTMRIAAKSQHRRMFKQEQRIADQAFPTCSDHLLLDAHGLRIGNSAEMKKVDKHRKFIVVCR